MNLIRFFSYSAKLLACELAPAPIRAKLGKQNTGENRGAAEIAGGGMLSPRRRAPMRAANSASLDRKIAACGAVVETLARPPGE